MGKGKAPVLFGAGASSYLAVTTIRLSYKGAEYSTHFLLNSVIYRPSYFV